MLVLGLGVRGGLVWLLWLVFGLGGLFCLSVGCMCCLFCGWVNYVLLRLLLCLLVLVLDDFGVCTVALIRLLATLCVYYCLMVAGCQVVALMMFNGIMY